VNAYKIYEVMYDEKEAKKTPGLPPWWTHARFLEELVYDFIFPGRSKNNVVIDPESMGNSDSSARMEASSICSFAVFGQGNDCDDCDEGVYDLRSSIGREQYLQAVPTVRISKGALEGYFSHRLNGMRHNWIRAKEADHCQFCYYQLMNKVPEEDRWHFTKSLRQNRSRIQRCLVCHVNLCPQCDNSFHGADLSAFSRGCIVVHLLLLPVIRVKTHCVSQSQIPGSEFWAIIRLSAISAERKFISTSYVLTYVGTTQ
jgi:hypothetical protein